MAERAEERGLLTAIDQSLCRAISTYDGDASHHQENPARQVNRSDALMLIGITSNVLCRLFPPSN